MHTMMNMILHLFIIKLFKEIEKFKTYIAPQFFN